MTLQAIVYSSRFQCHLEEPEEAPLTLTRVCHQTREPMPGVVEPKCGYTLFISAHCRRKLQASGSSSTWWPCLQLSWNCHGTVMCHIVMLSWWHSADLAAAAWYCWAGGCRNLMTVPTMSRVTRRSRSMVRVLGMEEGCLCGHFSVMLWPFLCCQYLCLLFCLLLLAVTKYKCRHHLYNFQFMYYKEGRHLNINFLWFPSCLELEWNEYLLSE